MSDYPLTVEEISSWFHSREDVSGARGVVLAGVHERPCTNKPAAFADFDTDAMMGRVCVWVSGEIDFEVIRRSDSVNVFSCHEEVSSLAGQAVDRAFDAFLKAMTNLQGDLLTFR